MYDTKQKVVVYMPIRILRALNYFRKDRLPLDVQKSEHNGHTLEHMHDFYEFVYIERGFLMHRCSDSFSMLLPGDFFGIAPQIAHEYIRANRAVLYNCLFHPDLFGCDMTALRTLQGLDMIFDPAKIAKPTSVRLDPSQRIQACAILRDLHSLQSCDDIGRDLMIKSRMIELMVLYAKAYSSNRSKQKTSIAGQSMYVYRALSHIETHYADRLTVTDIAMAAGITPDYLTKCFKTHLDMTPIDYLQRYKLGKALDYLSDLNYSITQVAQLSGFDHGNYFSRLFKQTFSISPSSYRASILTRTANR